MRIHGLWLLMLFVVAVVGAPALAATAEQEPQIWVLRFDLGGSALSDGHRAKLDEAAAALREDPSLGARIVGHSDDQGSEQGNLLVSRQRAEAVGAYLIRRRGIAPARIFTEAKGSRVPVASNETPEGRLRNRRVVVALTEISAARRQERRTWILRFDFGDAEISAASRASLDEVAAELARHPELEALVVGHSDASGQEPINLEVSRRRAEAAASYLSRRWGIDEARIRAQGKGSSRPVASNDTPEGQRRNRRVVVVLRDPAATTNERP